jgi:hypothetical protein
MRLSLLCGRSQGSFDEKNRSRRRALDSVGCQSHSVLAGGVEIESQND